MAKRKYRTVALASCALAAFAGAGPAAAQTPPSTAAGPVAPPTAEDPDGGLADIEVTARRTSEALQTTPVAVTALGNEALETKQIAAVADLGRATPSLSVGSGGVGPSTIILLAIRGQAQNAPNSFADAAVGIYVDGVYVARPAIGNLGFLDMGSAEVLRGPQGTLFGRNTTGGALNLTTARPTDVLEGYVRGGIGNYDQRVIEGVLNVPLSDTLAARFAGRYDEQEGYFPNEYLGRRQGSVNGSYFARGSISWKPTDLPVTLTVIGDHMDYRDNGNPTAVAAINPASPLAAFYGISQGVQSGTIPGGTPIPLGPGFSVPASTFANFARGGPRPLTDFINPQFPGSTADRDWRYSYQAPRTGFSFIDDLGSFTTASSLTANLVVDLGGVTVTSITGYRQSESGQSIDLTGTPTGAGAFAARSDQHQFSEEIQLSGRVGALDWVTGVNYFREAGMEESRAAIFYDTPIANFASPAGDFEARSIGVFSQLNYRVTDRLRVTGGLRYTWDKRVIDRHSVQDFRAADPICAVGANAGRPASAAPCEDRQVANFSYPAWLASVDYRISPDVFVYAKTSGASMSGGFNVAPVPRPFNAAFEPEDVRDVELGFKGEFLNRKVRINVAAFRAWQSNVQRGISATFVDDQGRTQLTGFGSNSGNVNTRGVEVEGAVVPWRGMTIDGSAAYLHARYAKGSRFENQLVGGTVVSVDRSGEPITQAPEWTAGLGATQEFDLAPGKLRLHLDYAYISGRYFIFATTGDPAQAEAVAIGNRASFIKGYGLVNGQVSFTLRDPDVELALWGKNMTGTKWFTNVFDSYNGLGATVQFQGAPSTYGATATFRF
ncbi:TonB-dependent receptor [Sphingomonas sp. Leaf412]|uniref:TonB-dependent receptor n=1 Tax=Sphingomonas sp. Leaf412 TaxID=1736370 RepID=UPI000AFED56B|nr:TonB-dependent receptor [Sphingomonas sp. Leaf412]